MRGYQTKWTKRNLRLKSGEAVVKEGVLKRVRMGFFALFSKILCLQWPLKERETMILSVNGI
jgi:hypothetical protein